INKEKLNEEINEEIKIEISVEILNDEKSNEEIDEEFKVVSIKLTPSSKKKIIKPFKKYKLKYIIGKGSEGCVYKAIDIHDNKLYAIKIIDLSEKNIIDS